MSIKQFCVNIGATLLMFIGSWSCQPKSAEDVVQPRNAHTLARSYSELSVPNGSRVIAFTDQFAGKSAVGSQGFLEITFALDSVQTRELDSQAR